MTISEVEQIVVDAVAVKEKSNDDSFASILQDRIESLLFKIEQIMGMSIADFPKDVKVPSDIEKMTEELQECFSL